MFVCLAMNFLSCLSWFVCGYFVLATSTRVRQADMREFSHHVMRAGDSSIWLLVFLQYASCRVSFSVLSFSILQHRRKATRTEIYLSSAINTYFRSISYSVSTAKRDRHTMKSKSASSCIFGGYSKPQ